jgi:phage terminase small subunit
MGLRGPAPTPTVIRKLNGNPSRRPFPENEPQYVSGVPDRPKGMSPGARKIWDQLVSEMAASRVLRLVDALALAQLCEDQAMLDELRHGVFAMKREIVKQARKQKRAIPGGALQHLSRTIEGRRTLSTMKELGGQIIIQRREFGLSPSSNSRVSAAGGADNMDSLEAALCG